MTCDDRIIVDETPELVASSLVAMEEELNKLPADKTKWVMQHRLHNATNKDNEGESSNRQDEERFMLQFLRTDVFQPALAAKRYAKYWENRVDLFGEDRAFRPMTQHGIMSTTVEGKHNAMNTGDKATLGECGEEKFDDLEVLSWGYLRTVPGHERVLLLDPARTCAKAAGKSSEEDNDNKPRSHKWTPEKVDSLVRSVWYVLSKAAESSEELQKKGVIFVMNMQHVKTFDRALVARIAATCDGAFPLRCEAFFILNPPRGTGFFINVAKLFFNPKVRDRFHVVYSGGKSEKLSKLQKLIGISAKDILSSVDHDAWLEEMRKKEQ